ncbi:MAG: hypothetical protein AB1513_12015 [Pseudomonadota bacterium]
MEITIGNNNDGDLIEVAVRYREVIDGHGYSAHVMVWVPNRDSRSEVCRYAAEEARKFLQRALAAHSAAYPQSGEA